MVVGDQTTSTLKGSYLSDLRVQKRLSGEDPDFVFGADQLKQLGLIKKDASGENAKYALSTIQTMGAAMVKKQTGSSSFLEDCKKNNIAGFHLDFSNGKSAQVNALSAADLEGVYQSLGAVNPDISLGQILGDILHFFEHLLEDILNIVIEIIEDGIKLVIKIAGEVLHFILKALGPIGAALEFILKKFASLVEDVVDIVGDVLKFIEYLFEWDDILLVKQVIESYFQKGMDNITNDVNNKIPQLIIGEFGKVKTDVINFFDNLENNIAGWTSFNQMIPSSSSPALDSTNPLTGNKVSNNYQENGARCNYAKSKALHHFKNVPPFGSGISAPEGSDFWKKIEQAFEASFNIDQIKAGWAHLEVLIDKLKSKGDFLDMLLEVLLEAIKDLVLLVLDGIEAFLLVAVDFLGEALSYLNSMLTKVIDIPVLSALYKKLSDHELNYP